MGKMAIDHIQQMINDEVKERFPDGAVRRVELLQHGDDPAVEPGAAGPGPDRSYRRTEELLGVPGGVEPRAPDEDHGVALASRAEASASHPA